MAGKTWIQSTPPPAGTTYEWAGEPHASESIKRVDGVEVARNKVKGGSFENAGLAGWKAVSSSLSRTSSFKGQMFSPEYWGKGPEGGRYGEFIAHVVANEPDRADFYIIQDSSSYMNISPGEWLGASALIASDKGAQSDLVIQFKNSSGATIASISDYREAGFYPGRKVHKAVQAPPNTVKARLVAWTRTADGAKNIEGNRMWAEGVIAVVSETEEHALTHSADYWDGDTPDDRADDTWINPETFQEYMWGGHSFGWVQRADRPRLTDNRLDVSCLTNPVDRGSTAPHSVYFENRWTHPDGGDARGYSDVWSKPEYPYVDPAIRVVLTGGTVKTTDGRDPVLMLKPGPGVWSEGATRGHHIKTEPGERLMFQCGLNRSWRDVTMFRDRGISVSIAFANSSGSWIKTESSPAVPAAPIDSPGSLLSFTATAPPGASWAYVILYVDAPAQTRTGNGALYITNPYFGTAEPAASGVTEVGIATSAREGLVSDVFARSRERIEVQLAQPDEQLIAGERIELAAFAATSAEVSWTWRQVTGPTVEIERKGNAAHFIAPDVNTPTDLRIACRAASTDGANRSNWHFFDLTIQPPRTRWIPSEGSTFTPRSPQMVGYDRGKREIWNDVTLPNGMDSSGRWENVLRDLGVPADDVQFVTDGEPPARAAAGGVYIDMETRDIYRNFGAGYNESDNTEGAPRRNAYMVNPATGDIFEWREGES